MSRPPDGPIPWWLWPTVLSLDAPIVALAWQDRLAQDAAFALHWSHAVVLGLSVWLAYAGDRWIEGWRLDPSRVRTQRHAFYQRHRWPIALVAGLILLLDVGCAVAGLTPREFQAGLLLLPVLLTYLLSHQLVHRTHPWRLPKEALVAVLMGAGAALFMLASPTADHATLVAPLGLFVLLSFTNCALISAWEHHVDRSHNETSLALQFSAGAWIGRALVWIIVPGAALLWFVGGPALRPTAGCAAASALLLAGVDLAEGRLGPRPARVLADVALMTPLIPLLYRTLG